MCSKIPGLLPVWQVLRSLNYPEPTDDMKIAGILKKIFREFKKSPSHPSIAGLRCEFGGHLPISSKKCPRPIQVVLGGSYAF